VPNLECDEGLDFRIIELHASIVELFVNTSILEITMESGDNM
jgi:hypothetical protein